MYMHATGGRDHHLSKRHVWRVLVAVWPRGCVVAWLTILAVRPRWRWIGNHEIPRVVVVNLLLSRHVHVLLVLALERAWSGLVVTSYVTTIATSRPCVTRRRTCAVVCQRSELVPSSGRRR